MKVSKALYFSVPKCNKDGSYVDVYSSAIKVSKALPSLNQHATVTVYSVINVSEALLSLYQSAIVTDHTWMYSGTLYTYSAIKVSDALLSLQCRKGEIIISIVMRKIVGFLKYSILNFCNNRN
jgi:hypothetical protein